MALLQKKPTVQSSAPLYTLGASKNVLIVGLGNIGKEFTGTRHNIGFEAVEAFAVKNDFPAWMTKKDLKCEVAVHTLGENRVILCKPTTLMNNSGDAVQAVQSFYRIYNQQTLVVYDELAIPFGQVRTRIGGSDAGHNGIKSLIKHIDSDFGRLRIGIGTEISKKADAADYVLGKFTKQEQGSLPQVIREANAIITEFIFGGALPHETRTVL